MKIFTWTRWIFDWRDRYLKFDKRSIWYSCLVWV